MILLIDNYDSFSYNLYQLLGSIEPDISVIRNDELSVDEIEKRKPEAIVLSPGPGRPADAGVCIDVVKALRGKIPLLGVCLGHQAICEAYGGTVTYASELMHGKKKPMLRVGESLILDGLTETFYGARYHSLAAAEETLPEELHVVSRSPEGEVMAVEDPQSLVFGLQFHPESVMTDDGYRMMENFMRVVRKHG